MSRSVRLVLLSLTLFLVLFPLAAGRPGQPSTLKADEPAYFLMAMSLIEDGDLRCEVEDIQRAFDHYPYLPLNNLILMTTDGWETVFFGKPYIYSLFAVPAAMLFGVNGFPAFNMLLLMAMVWMGASYLRRFNSDSLSALFSTAFFVLSPAFAYVFWIHPEIINMFSIAACLYMAFHQPADATGVGRWESIRRTLFGPRLRPVWSGAALALSVYNKPMLGILGIPALWLFFRRDGLKGAASWIASAGIALATIAGVSVALTGQPSAYLGVDRGGLKILTAETYVESLDKLRNTTEAHADEAANSWQWMFRLPKIDPRQFAEDSFYFLIGRHTGLVPYMPFAVLAMLLFILHSRGSPERWLTLGALIAVALTFLVWIPFNWHGGGGFIGNRYYVNAYPAFLFLVTTIRPAWLPVAGSAVAAVLLGSIIFTPWGAGVPSPSMQAHVRGGLFRFFPLELSLRRRIPGYDSFGFRGVGFLGRRDVFHIEDEPTGAMWIRGATRTEIWINSYEPAEKLIFDVFSWNPQNEIVLEVPGDKQTLIFDRETSSSESQQRVVLKPSRPTRTRRHDGKLEYVYRLLVSPRTGRHRPGNMLNAFTKPLFYIGAQLSFIGTDENVPPRAGYRIAWEECSIPARMEAGTRVDLPVRVRNTSEITWAHKGRNQINLAYRWLDETGERLEAPRGRAQLYRNVRPGEDILKKVGLLTPETPGRYVLVLDAIRRNVALFSSRGGDTCEDSVEVVPSGGDSEDSVAGPE